MEAVLGERDLKAGVQSSELVGVGNMASASIQEKPLFVHEALEPELDERGRTQDPLGSIGLVNRDGETAGGKAKGNTGRTWDIPLAEPHRRNKRFEAIGQGLARGRVQPGDHKRV